MVFKICIRPSCRICPFTGLRPGQVQKSITAQSIMVSSTGEEPPIRGRLTCPSSHLFYTLPYVVGKYFPMAKYGCHTEPIGLLVRSLWAPLIM